MGTAPASPAISGIGQIAVNVHNIERAIAFYRDTLRLPFLFGGGKLAFFHCGGVRLMLSPPEKPEFDHASSILYFKVGDLESEYRRMKDEGVVFEDEPHLVAKLPDHELWMTFFRDSENNLLALMSEVR